MFDKKELLRILDIYPHYVNVKNGHRAFNTKIIIMTADDELKNVFGALCERDYKQLERRIKIIRKFE